MKKFLLHFSYDGHPFHGWQIQKDTLTIQQVMEKALFQIFKVETPLTVSGRTDAGVHALNQYAHFTAKTRMEPENIIPAINSIIPKAIYIKECTVVDDAFHARFSAKKRTYMYKIMKEFSPFERLYASYFLHKKLSLPLLQRASEYLLGTHDFNVFAHDTSQLTSTQCTVDSADWSETDTHLTFEICANRFMHNMVRRIVGTLLHISHEGLEPEHIDKILSNQDYNLLGMTAPPQGLYLFEVTY
ncbi:MAG: tRNA pseudouridine(38-40) synthase TruA [Candidatus Celaenobacter antarcticus]|nr:tRNA pseudouridine(38-40) synthase TruA [Candidatus Celaenobacter antarcticus]MDP8315719.1 tRNA pseudouridine(38-40) synthase TruA [Candidatus Celaenobacter antarcticus]